MISMNTSSKSARPISRSSGSQPAACRTARIDSTSRASWAVIWTMRPVTREFAGQRRRQRLVELEAQHRARRPGQQRRRAVEGDDAALLEHRDARAQRLGLLEVVRRQQHGMALLVEAGDELPERLAQLDVDARGGLVEDDHGRAVHQRLGDQDAPLHAARELAHVGVALVGEAEVGEQLVDPGVVGVDAEIAALDAQRLAHGKNGSKTSSCGHDADLPARRRVVAVDVVAEDGDASRRRTRQTGEDADQRRLAGAVRAEQAEELALLDVEADVVEGAHVAASRGVGLGDVDERDGRHGGRDCREPNR
jgi:hypothetical protein